jgi:tetratricopeptide (TPR) repeat protein
MQLRRADEAERLFRRSLEILEPIRVANRGNPELLRQFSSSYNHLGRIDLDRGRPADARAWYQRTIDLLQPGPSATAPADPQNRSFLDRALRGRLRANSQLGRIDEALADWDRLAAILEPEEKGLRPMGPILVRAWSGDAAGFLAGARHAVESGSVPVEELITLAEAAAQAAARARADPALPASVRTRQADELAAQAVGWLERAGAAGYFRKSDHKTQLIEPRFDALRLRPRFRALLGHVFFPDDPFAGPP